MIDKTLIFYSGKLWHSDKPFPVKPEEQNYNPELRDHQYPDDLVIYWDKVKLWLSTAYEVVNRTDRRLNKHNELHDGDQITLPDGYGIEKKEVNCGGKNCPGNDGCWGHPKGCGYPDKKATITLPETDYSTMITPEMNERLTKPITSFSEPSESQEELSEEIVNVIWNLGDTTSLLHCKNYIKEHYILTRRK